MEVATFKKGIKKIKLDPSNARTDEFIETLKDVSGGNIIDFYTFMYILGHINDEEDEDVLKDEQELTEG